MDINLSKSTLRAVLCTWLGVCVLYLGGCSESAGTSPDLVGGMNDTADNFRSASNSRPTAKTLYALAKILASQGKDSECEYVLRRILRENPEYLPAYNSLAELQMRRGLTNEAIEILKGALKLHPGEPTIVNNLGMCRIVLCEYEDALQMFTEAAGKMPEYSRYRANMAVALGLLGREEESLALFSQVMGEEDAIHNLFILREAGNVSEQTIASVGPERIVSESQ